MGLSWTYAYRLINFNYKMERTIQTLNNDHYVLSMGYL